MFNKKLKQQISVLQDTVDSLQKTIETNELTRLRNESNNYKMMCDDVRNIALRVKSVKTLYDDDGNLYIEVRYETPVIKMPVNANGDVLRNEFFRSVNRLNLLSQKDMLLLDKILSDAKQKAKL